MFKRSCAAAVLALAAFFTAGCSSPSKPVQSSEMQFSAPPQNALTAIFDTSLGSFKAVLYPDYAPRAVENFVTLAQQGFFDGQLFHRVVQDFVIQSGDPTGTGGGGQSIWGVPFADEFSDRLHHYTGALSMANSGKNANQSQFFVVATPADSVPGALAAQMEEAGWRPEVINAYLQAGGAPYLDYLHTVFGQVIEGMEVVEKIGSTAADPATERPKRDVVLYSVSIARRQQEDTGQTV